MVPKKSILIGTTHEGLVCHSGIITLPFFPCSRECCRFFGDNGLTMKVFFIKAAPFGVLWTLTNYLYLHAIKKINTTDVSVLFCCNKAFVFLLSWIVLRDRFMGVRVSVSLSLCLPPSFTLTLFQLAHLDQHLTLITAGFSDLLKR